MSHFAPKVPLKPETFNVLLPGISSRATSLSQELLIRNNREHHIFFNDKKFHNHLTHHLMAAYALGASTDRLQTIYDAHASYQRKLPETKDSLTRENFNDKLGQADAYGSYLKFFEKEIDNNGTTDTVRRWVWSDTMFARTFGGIFHALIHIGYGIEFGLSGLVAEGLAMAACTEATLRPVIPDQKPLNASYLMPVQAANAAATAAESAQGLVSRMTSQFRTGMGLGPTTSGQPTPRSECNSLVDLVLEIQKDNDFLDVVKFTDDKRAGAVLHSEKAVKKIETYLSRWSIEETAKGTQEKLRELYWATLLVFGASGIRDQGVKLDFSLMHSMTSISFVHHFLPHISPSEAASMLRAHFASTLVYYIACGRPSLQVDLLLKYKPEKYSDPDDRKSWSKVLDMSIEAEEPHVIKVVRACALGQILYGHSQDPEQEQAWLHVAQLAIDQDGDWNFDGIGFDDAWKK